MKFHEHVDKLLSMDMIGIRDVFFNLIDLNRDKKICEADLFNVLKML